MNLLKAAFGRFFYAFLKTMISKRTQQIQYKTSWMLFLGLFCGFSACSPNPDARNIVTRDSTELETRGRTDSVSFEEEIGTEDIDITYHKGNASERKIYNTDEEVIRGIFDEALLNGRCYDLLRYLSKEIGSRLSGSPQAAAAVEWAYQTLDTMEVERVWKQGVMVPHWIRGDIEVARVINSASMGSVDLSVCALGGSVPTPENGLTAPVVEVNNFQELKRLG